MIVLDSLQRSFGDFRLGPLSLRIERGEYWIVLGPSGSGKSMLLHTLAGLFTPDSGTIAIADKDVTSLPPERRNIGLVFQRPALFPHMSVLENIAYGLRARRFLVEERKARIDAVVATVGLADILELPTATLSGGEAQRVAIARALATQPDVLLLDEPFGPLDHNARLGLQVQLKRIHQELGLTTIHVTHSRDEARALGDHCVVMQGGQLVAQGAVMTEDGVFALPRCSFVASFLGMEAPAAEQHPSCARACVGEAARCDFPVRG